MGTLREWALVAFAGIFWTAFEALRVIVSGRKLLDKNARSLTNLIANAVLGCFIGILIAFRRQAFRWPIVLITIPVFIGVVIAGRAKAKAQTTR